MNNPLSTIAAFTPTNAAPDATTTAAAGEAGAFALLFGAFTQTPAPGSLKNAVADATATPMPAQGAEMPSPALALAPMPVIVPDAARTEPATTAQQPDAALIAALLGQLQMPYALLSPAMPEPSPLAPSQATEARTRVATPLPEFTAPPALPNVPATQNFTATPAVATPTATSVVTQQPPAPNLDAVALPPSAASVVAAAQVVGDSTGSDAPAAVAPLSSAGEPKAGPQAALINSSPTPQPMPLTPAATAAIPHVPVQSAPLPHADREARDYAVATPSHADNAGSVESTDNSQAARRQPYAGHGRAFELKGTDFDSAADKEIIALPTIETSVAIPPQGITSRQARDPGSDFAMVSAAPSAMPATFATRGDTPPPQLNIAPPLQTPEWQPAFANSVKLLVNEGTSAASLQLNPAEFGPIDVRIVVTDQRADISFMVTHPDANAAIQSSLSELRDQLARSGIQLGETSVGAHPQDRRPPAGTPQRDANANTHPGDAPSPGGLPPVRPRGSGKIDIYA